MIAEQPSLGELWRGRDRPRYVFWSILLASCGALIALVSCLIDAGGFFSGHRLSNIERFIGEITPYPLAHPDRANETIGEWAIRLGSQKVIPGSWKTLLLSVVAGGLAGALALLSLGGSARNLACSRPLRVNDGGVGGWQDYWWRGVVVVTRGAQILFRALPEYVLAFLLVGLLGLGYWPVILALAVHNAGILGRLGAEVVENASPTLPRVMRATGSGRAQLLWLGLLPELLGRFLVFFFYRWETCVREATVLGFVGVSSLGFYIQDARARDLYDEMIVLVIAGAVLVVAGDLVSAAVRARLGGGGGRRC